MKKILIFITFLLILCLGIFIGLKVSDNIKQSKTSEINESKVDNNEIINEIPVTIDKKEDNQVTDNKTMEVTKVESYTDKDNKVIDDLDNALKKIKESEVTDKFKDSCKATFITVVDFLFYEGKINGVTFNELSQSGKAKVLEIANSIDEAIESKYPNYKDDISSTTKSAYNEAARLIKKGSSNLDSFLKEHLSDSNYQTIIDAKDDLVYYTKNAVNFIKDNGSKIINNAKNKLAEWYKTLKD